jgi:hypothetical protein
MRLPGPAAVVFVAVLVWTVVASATLARLVFTAREAPAIVETR